MRGLILGSPVKTDAGKNLIDHQTAIALSSIESKLRAGRKRVSFVAGLDTAHAQDLCKAMLEARQVFLRAQANYHSVLALALDTAGIANGSLVLRREGRALAQALTHYADASMAWLKFVDALLHPKAREKDLQLENPRSAA